MCFNPKFAYFDYEISKTKNQTKPTINKKIIFIKKDEAEIDALRKDIIIIPCGKCLACRINQANNWATRCYLESKKWKNNFFITLTIDEENNTTKSLSKNEIQKFIKRLRKNQGGDIGWEREVERIRYKRKKKKIIGSYRVKRKEFYTPLRYFLCGEYGSKTFRPHYHLGIFNLKPFDDTKYWKKSKTGYDIYVSDKLNKIWKKGYAYIQYMSYETAAYIARYTQKKIKRNYDKICENLGLEKEFKLTSRRPGIALDITTNKTEWEKIKANFGILVRNKDGNIKLKGIPQALRQKWRDIDRIEYFEKADENTLQHKEQLKKELEKTSLTPRQYRIMKAKATEDKLKRLVRNEF